MTTQKRRNLHSPVKSPYFDSSQRRRQQKLCSGSCSNYFINSPSSTYGSIQSLGPLIYTWISNDLNATSATEFCHRPKPVESLSSSAAAASSSTTLAFCSSCKVAINSALVPFLQCPIFKKNYNQVFNNITKGNDLFQQGETTTTTTSLSCIEMVGTAIEQNVRHLCTNRCFYRAFCPARDWVAFRKAVHKQTDDCLDCILGGWTCKLVQQEMEGKEGVQHVTRRQPPPPRTLFFSAVDQQRYLHVGEAMKKLRMATPIVKATNVQQSSPTKSTSMTCRHRREFPPKKEIMISASNKISLESPLGLIEELFGDNPWQLLLCTIMLNRTTRIQVDCVLLGFLDRWPTPEATLEEDVEEICRWITPLGIKGRRSRGILRFCKEYLQLRSSKKKKSNNSDNKALNEKRNVEFQFTRKEISSLYHCGDYAADAYQIFIQKDWMTLDPKDHALRAYVEWKRCDGVVL